MYIHEQITNEKSLDKALQQLRESDSVFVLDLSHLPTISSKAIQSLVETHVIFPDRLYVLVAESSNVMGIIRRECLLGILNIFDQIHELDVVLTQQNTPCQRSYFPGPIFKIGQDAQNELDRVAEVCGRTGKCNISLGLRQEFLQRNFPLPAALYISKVEGEWWICEASNTQQRIPNDHRSALYIIRLDVYGQALEVCQQILTLTLKGTLRGREHAKEFLYKLRDENSPIVFINLNSCYSWDEEYAKAYRKAKEYKKIFLIRSDNLALDFLFHVEGDIFYSDYEKAYTNAALLIKRQWRIKPNPDGDDFEPQTIVEISGYVSDQETELVEFAKKLLRVLRRTIRKLHRMCIDIRELYRLETKAREILVENITEWCRQHKVRRTNIIIIATLPRPDYTIQDVIADLYEHGFFIVPTPEEAIALLESYPHPRFVVENSTTASILRMEGNIVQEQELLTFKNEVNNLVHNALSLNSDSSHVLRSPQQTVFFDFSNIPCVYSPVIQSILDIDTTNPNLSKILLVNAHLAELIRKLFGKDDPRHSNVFCYENKEVAINNHIRNVLIVAPKMIADKVREYFERIFQEIYHTTQAKNTQFRVRFHFDFERLSARLGHDSYDLLIFYGYTHEEDRQKIDRFLSKYSRPVLELIDAKEWVILRPQQLELSASISLLQNKISGLLWHTGKQQREYRFLLQGQHWESSYNTLQRFLNDEVWEVIKTFLPVVDDAWYEFILTQKEHCSQAMQDVTNIPDHSLEKLEFHPYRHWLRNFSYYFNDDIITLCQKVSDENGMISALDVAGRYSGYEQNLWSLLPTTIRRSQEERWMTLEIITNKLLTAMFLSPLFEVQAHLIVLHTELSELFDGQIWLATRQLWDSLRQDIRYRNFEDPILGMIQLCLNLRNEQNIQQGQPWLTLLLQIMEEDTGLKATITMDNIGKDPKLPENLATSLNNCQNQYHIEAQGRITPDVTTVEIVLQIRGKNKR